MTYRTGNHWGVTIVREPDDHGGPVPEPDELVAVVVNGDTALAERICALLNGAHTPDVDHARGAAEGYEQAIAILAGVAHRTDSPAARWAAEYLADDPDRLGPREDAPSQPPSAPVAAEQPSAGGNGYPRRRLRACVESWPDAETGAYNPACCRWPKSCSATVYDPKTVADTDLEPREPERPSAGGSDRAEAAETLRGHEGLDPADAVDCRCLYCRSLRDGQHPPTPRRADEHTEECR